MIRRPPRSTQSRSSAASDVYKRQIGDGGVVRGVFGLGRDVSERRRAERAMERSELRLRTLVNETNQMTWVTGLDGAIDSPAGDWMAFTGQSAEEMLGEGWLQVVHPDDCDRVAATWRDATSAGGVYECEYRLRGADGEYRWMASRAVPLAGADGGTEYFGVGQDVSERRRAEDALRRQFDLDAMLAAISSRLMSGRAPDVREVFDYALAEVGLGTGVSGRPRPARSRRPRAR